MLLLVEELQEQQYKKLIADAEYDLNRKFRELIGYIYLPNGTLLYIIVSTAIRPLGNIFNVIRLKVRSARNVLPTRLALIRPVCAEEF